MMLPRNRILKDPGEGESRVRGIVHAQFARGGTGDPARNEVGGQRGTSVCSDLPGSLQMVCHWYAARNAAGPRRV